MARRVKFHHLRVLLWTMLVLCLGEVVLEVRAYRRGFTTILFGFEAPQASSGMESRFGPTDGFPFRSLIVEPEDDASTRIWLSSASYAEDVYLPPDVIFPHRIQDFLEEEGFAVQVLNASRAGITIPTNTSDLATDGQAWNPDFALLYQLSMDLNALSERYLGSSGTIEGSGTDPRGPLENRDRADTGISTVPWMTRMVEQTTLYALLQGNVTVWLKSFRLLHDSLPAAAEAAFRGRIEDYIRTAENAGAAPLCATLATSYVEGQLEEVPRQIHLSLLRYNPYLSMRGWLREVERFNESIRSLSSSGECHLIDLADALGGRSELFRDFVHLTIEGHEEMARELTERLVPILSESTGN